MPHENTDKKTRTRPDREILLDCAIQTAEDLTAALEDIRTNHATERTAFASRGISPGSGRHFVMRGAAAMRRNTPGTRANIMPDGEISVQLTPAERIYQEVFETKKNSLAFVPPDIDETMRRILQELPERQALILKRLYYEKASRQDVAQELHVTLQRVQQGHAKTISILRRPQYAEALRYGDQYFKKLEALHAEARENSEKILLEKSEKILKSAGAALTAMELDAMKSMAERLRTMAEMLENTIEKSLESPDWEFEAGIMDLVSKPTAAVLSGYGVTCAGDLGHIDRDALLEFAFVRLGKREKIAAVTNETARLLGMLGLKFNAADPKNPASMLDVLVRDMDLPEDIKLTLRAGGLVNARQLSRVSRTSLSSVKGLSKSDANKVRKKVLLCGAMFPEPKPPEHPAPAFRNVTVEDLHLSPRSEHALRHNGIHDLETLSKHNSESLLNMPRIGVTSLKEIIEAAAMHGLPIY